MDDITSFLIRMIPPLLVWTTGVILSVKMLRRGGGTPEKLFVAACSMLLFKTVLSPLPRIFVNVWMDSDGMSALSVGVTMTVVSIPILAISLAGFVCLVIAFWIKFRDKKSEVIQ